MALRIDPDHRRFRDIVRGKIKQDLRKYISQGELIGRKGKDKVSIPLPQINVPRFRFGSKDKGGVGQGQGEVGDSLGKGDPNADGAGKAGDQAGDHALEVELSLEELAQIMGEELQLPRIEPKGKQRIISQKDKYVGIRRTGPESLRHFKRTFHQALRRQIMTGTYDKNRPFIVPVREDRRYRSWRTQPLPQSNAVMIFIMDVSGSMGDEQKEIVRIESFWIDTWLRSQYKGLESRYIIHDAVAKEVDRDTFFKTRESGGTMISSAYKLCAKMIEDDFPPSEWNIYPFHFSDGDNWSVDDTVQCVELLKAQILPKVNLFCYGQVESPYGSGQFIKDLNEHFDEDDSLVVSEIKGKEAIMDSIRDFLGQRASRAVAQLPAYLHDIQREVEAYGRAYGLDFWGIEYEILDYKKMQEVAAFGGFPVRYPHWRFGMEFEHLTKSHIYGLSKIYEMVINNDPAYAYLLEGNSLVDQKMVMAHVLGHVDFFKNNYFFSKTNRRMIDGMANHATRVRRHVERLGLDKVETFIDSCLCIENLIDPMSPFIARKATERERAKQAEQKETPEIPRIRAKSYMDKFINPPEYIDEQRRKIEVERDRPKKHPAEPERDVLLFLLQNAPLDPWERDILEIVRDEAYYFAPQRQTKILNEGWASYWHSRIMTEKALKASEIIDYADHNAGVLATAPGQFNPYKIGIELLRDVEERWDKGRFGREWNECQNLDERRAWDKRVGLGRKKIFEVRKLYNDVTFIDEFFTSDFCERNKFFSFSINERSGNYEIDSREFDKIKHKILFQLTNFGDPFIFVEDANHDNRGELLIRHRHEGTDLQVDHARDTITALARVWRRPVNLVTVVEGKQKMIRYDGKEHTERSVGG